MSPLVSDLIGHRGFDRQIENQYETAHHIVEQDNRSKATGDELRRAMGLYAMLFHELLAKLQSDVLNVILGLYLRGDLLPIENLVGGHSWLHLGRKSQK